jgi:hypothetical protein
MRATFWDAPFDETRGCPASFQTRTQLTMSLLFVSSPPLSQLAFLPNFSEVRDVSQLLGSGAGTSGIDPLHTGWCDKYC